ncbi:hypothetical protein NFI96_028831 [Prochilodus magdalenae]|nr:hypothetical protein NFI96_028831 [Prochilodus magdalenae]
MWSSLQHVDKWTFDVFALNEASGDHALKFIFYELLTRYDLISRFKIPISALVSFVEALEVGYSKHKNPYHNLIHAADVTQTVHYLLLRTGMVHWLTELEIFAMIFAAAVHDYEHTGTTNNFHIQTRSDTAILYNDRAVLESHHVSAAYRLLQDDDEMNILYNLSKDDWREFRALVVEMVLATDMSCHFQQVKAMKNFLQQPEGIDKSKALSLLLHTADISHPAKNWELHHRWTTSLLEEFFRQACSEAEVIQVCECVCESVKAENQEIIHLSTFNPTYPLSAPPPPPPPPPISSTPARITRTDVEQREEGKIFHTPLSSLFSRGRLWYLLLTGTSSIRVPDLGPVGCSPQALDYRSSNGDTSLLALSSSHRGPSTALSSSHRGPSTALSSSHRGPSATLSSSHRGPSTALSSSHRLDLPRIAATQSPQRTEGPRALQLQLLTQRSLTGNLSVRLPQTAVPQRYTQLLTQRPQHCTQLLTQRPQRYTQLLTHRQDTRPVCCSTSRPSAEHGGPTALEDTEGADGDKEAELGLPFSPLCDRKSTMVAQSQIGFIDFIVVPTFTVLTDMTEKIVTPLIDEAAHSGLAGFRRSSLSNISAEGKRASVNSAVSESSVAHSCSLLAVDLKHFKALWNEQVYQNRERWKARADKEMEEKAKREAAEEEAQLEGAAGNQEGQMEPDPKSTRSGQDDPEPGGMSGPPEESPHAVNTQNKEDNKQLHNGEVSEEPGSPGSDDGGDEAFKETEGD